VKKITHEKSELDDGAKSNVEDEMKTSEYGQSIMTINKGFGGVSIYLRRNNRFLGGIEHRRF
jgi:hypothetical protein